MLFLLALLACEQADIAMPIDGNPVTDPQPVSPVLTEAPPIQIPDGEPIVRDCFGGGSNRNQLIGGRSGGGQPTQSSGPDGTRSRPMKKPSAKPTPAPQPIPVRPPTTPRAGDDAASAPAVGLVGKSEDKKKEASRESAVATPTADAPDSSVSEKAAGKDRLDRRSIEDNDAAVDGVAMREPMDEGEAEVVLDDRTRGDAEPPLVEEAKPIERSRWDWGATVYLSNDDSMSLASAQRVLFATANNVRLKASEIRPHELLNYFSFDTNPVKEGQLFSVLGVGEQHGDTLQVAMSVQGANPPRQALDLTLVVDRSCSMQAEDRMSYTKKGMTIMSDSLKEGDRVDLVLFDSYVCTPLENFVVGRDDPQLLTNAINAIQPTSATDLDAGLREAYRIQTGRDASETHLRNRRVMVITDADLNSGNINESLVSEVGKQFETNNIRMTGIGVGREFNDKMLDQLTEKGKGAYIYLGSDAVVERVFGPGFDSMTRTIAHDVQFSIELPNSLAMEKFYGEESSTNPEDVQPINYYANTSQVFLQDLHMRDGHAVRTDPVVLRIRYRDAVTGEPGMQELRTTIGALLEGDTHNLHKAQALIAWSDVLLNKAMGGDACGAPLAKYSELASQLSDDAEIAYVNGLIGKTCRVDMAAVVAAGVDYKVRVDSDIPIAEVELSCQGRSSNSKLSASDTIARFGNAKPGPCTLTLKGQMPMRAEVEVPETGGDLRCVVRGGRMNCS